MPYLTLTENLKLQLSPGLVTSYDMQPGNGVGLFWDKHTHTFTYLLTCPWPTRGTTERPTYLQTTTVNANIAKMFWVLLYSTLS